MGLFDSFLGLGVSAGANYLNGLMSTAFSKELQENQGAVNYKYAEKSACNAPTWNRAGLVSAGYNPMLAVQNATSGVNSSWTSGNTMNPQDMTSSAGNLIANAQASQRLENETHVSDTTADKNEAEAQEARARATKQELENPYVSAEQEAKIAKMSAETANIERSTEHFEAIEHNMQVLQRLQEMGINLDYASKIYSADKSYNASTYASNVAKYGHYINEVNNIRNNRTQRGSIGLFGSKWFSPAWADKFGH